MINTFLRLYGAAGLQPAQPGDVSVHLARGEFVKERGPWPVIRGRNQPASQPAVREIRSASRHFPASVRRRRDVIRPLVGAAASTSASKVENSRLGKELLAANYFPVSADFHTLNVRFARPQLAQDATAPPVVIVNDTMAHRFGPMRSSGEAFRIDIANEPPREIVGVVGVCAKPLRQKSPNRRYLPHVSGRSHLRSIRRAAADHDICRPLRRRSDAIGVRFHGRSGWTGACRFPISRLSAVCVRATGEPRQYMRAEHLQRSRGSGDSRRVRIMAYSVRQRMRSAAGKLLGAGPGGVAPGDPCAA